MLSAMILGAGFGTRLRPLTDVLPKPMLPVGDRAAVLHIVGQLRDAGVTTLALNTHHRAEAFGGVIAAGVQLVHEEGQLLGTAGGVAHARHVLGEGAVIVWNGDVLSEPDVAGLMRPHEEVATVDPVATLLAVDRRAGEGTLGVGREGNVVRLRGQVFGEEVRGADFLGIQVLTERGRTLLPTQGCLVGDVYLPALHRGDRVQVAWHPGEWDDIGSPHALINANLRWLRRHELERWIAPSARVHAGAIVEHTVVSQGAVVHAGAVVRECLLLEGAEVRGDVVRAIVMQDGRVVPA